MMARQFSAVRQFLTGKVHFFSMFLIARKSGYVSESSFGNDPRVFVTLRSDMFIDSIALVV